jgi:hypothetical protein
VTESQQQSELGRDDNSGGPAPGKAAAAGLGHESGGSEEHAVDRGPATSADANPDDEDRTRRGGGFATDDVREDAKYADGGGDVSANPVGGIGRDTGSASEGGPGTEGGLGSD